jgi:hypothetical protein
MGAAPYFYRQVPVDLPFPGSHFQTVLASVSPRIASDLSVLGGGEPRLLINVWGRRVGTGAADLADRLWLLCHLAVLVDQRLGTDIDVSLCVREKISCRWVCG